MTTDPATGKTAGKAVVATHINLDTVLTDLTVGKAVLKTTANHPFWSKDRKAWIEAADLEIEEHLRTADSTRASVTRVTTYQGARAMYDLTVDTVHTYYVLAGNTPVLVHNTNGCIPWSNGSVSSAARSIDNGATSISVRSRAEAEELFLGKYQGQGYRNATGFDGVGTKQYFGSKVGTYHWDDVVGADGRVVGHGANNADGALPHLQVHTFEGPIVRIFWGG